MAIAEREVVPQTQKRLYTEEEYLALEEAVEGKSEYIHGEICPMSGGTDYHGALAMRLGSALIIALKGRGCLVMSSDVKVRAGGEMYYPDVSVTCGPRQYFSGNRTVITNPLLVAEVLSPSTEGKDRGEKFHNYLTVASLAVYLLVSQDEPRVEQFSRADDGRWSYTLASGLEDILDIPALSVSLTLADIYEGIEFIPEPSDE
jgi:Uma2 family endonuclease